MSTWDAISATEILWSPYEIDILVEYQTGAYSNARQHVRPCVEFGDVTHSWLLISTSDSFDVRLRTPFHCTRECFVTIRNLEQPSKHCYYGTLERRHNDHWPSIVTTICKYIQKEICEVVTRSRTLDLDTHTTTYSRLVRVLWNPQVENLTLFTSSPKLFRLNLEETRRGMKSWTMWELKRRPEIICTGVASKTATF